MCGRYALTASAEELVETFDVPPPAFELVPRYNVCPGQDAPVVAEDRKGRRLGLLTWGFVPASAAEPRPGIVNARSESLHSRPAFREAFDRRRCLVPANGFYEWTSEDGAKIPHWIHPEDGALVSFAAIWERWSRPGAPTRYTFAILTRPASPEVAPLHDRMPVIVRPADRDRWLDRTLSGGDVRDVLRAEPEVRLEHYRVSTRVNRGTEDDPGLLEPVD
ncbi:MAG TPA: SOS response-associated peptidase [Longimicrobiales bacterium]|nr:SOS response-associated peptidase [Longimicrobiales bacterium]